MGSSTQPTSAKPKLTETNITANQTKKVQVHSDASSTPVSPEPPPATKSSAPLKEPSTVALTSHTPPSDSLVTTTTKTNSTLRPTANTSSVVMSLSTWKN